eukprot:7872855-Heterocapsa_arctica.AAC.1
MSRDIGPRPRLHSNGGMIMIPGVRTGPLAKPTQSGLAKITVLPGVVFTDYRMMTIVTSVGWFDSGIIAIDLPPYR